MLKIKNPDTSDKLESAKEKEAREKAERKRKAKQLKSEGKTTQAFFVEFQNGIIITAALLGLLIFFFVIKFNEDSKKEEAQQIHAQLELIEDELRIQIEKGNYDAALQLASKLDHPLDADMEHMEFDMWHGYPKYNQFWAQKKEDYKELIFNNGSLSEDR